MNKPKYLEANGSTLEYFEAGAGSPVVLLHCTGGSSRQWSALSKLLAPHRRVVTANLYGYGGSSAWDGRSAFRLRHEAALVQQLLRELGQPAHLVGHSYGGAVSLCVARAVPQDVRSLCLFEPASFHLLRTGDPRDLQALDEITQVARAIWDALASGEYVMGSQCFVDYWSGCGAWMGLRVAQRENLLARLPKIGLDFQAAIHEPARIDDFRDLPMPRLVVSGEKTTRAATRICDALGGIWPDAGRTVVRGAGHMGPVTHAAEVNGVISGFLGDPHRRGSRSRVSDARFPGERHRPA